MTLTEKWAYLTMKIGATSDGAAGVGGMAEVIIVLIAFFGVVLFGVVVVEWEAWNERKRNKYDN